MTTSTRSANDAALPASRVSRKDEMTPQQARLHLEHMCGEAGWHARAFIMIDTQCEDRRDRPLYVSFDPYGHGYGNISLFADDLAEAISSLRKKWNKAKKQSDEELAQPIANAMLLALANGKTLTDAAVSGGSMWRLHQLYRVLPMAERRLQEMLKAIASDAPKPADASV